MASLFSFLGSVASGGPPGHPRSSPPPSPAGRPAREATQTAEQAAQAFFAAVHAGRYREAYARLAPGVQRDLSYAEFELHSREVLAARVVELVATDRSRTLVRFRVKGRLRIRYQGELFDAVYAGQAAMVRVGAKWYIDEVDMKAIEQRPVKKKAPGYHI